MNKKEDRVKLFETDYKWVYKKNMYHRGKFDNVNAYENTLEAMTLNDFNEHLHIKMEDLNIIEKLNKEQYFTDAIVGTDDNVYILIYNDTIPSSNKPLSIAKDDVIKDLTAQKLRKRFKEEVQILTDKLENISIQSHDSFKIFAEQNELHLLSIEDKTASELYIFNCLS